jgi:hypothetical protein
VGFGSAYVIDTSDEVLLRAYVGRASPATDVGSREVFDAIIFCVVCTRWTRKGVRNLFRRFWVFRVT